MRTQLLMPLLTAALVFGGCAEHPIGPGSELPVYFAKPDHAGNGNGGGGGDDGDGSSVAFRNTVNAPDGDRILADDDRPYVDGEEGVLIAFESDRIRFQPRANKKGIRSVFLDLFEVVEGSHPFSGDLLELADASQLTVHHPLQSMADGESLDVPASLLWQQHPRDPVYRLGFGVESGGIVLGDGVTVTRSTGADGSARWTVESLSTETAVLQDLSASGNPILGTFHVSFELTVERPG